MLLGKLGKVRSNELLILDLIPSGGLNAKRECLSVVPDEYAVNNHCHRMPLPKTGKVRLESNYLLLKEM